MSFLAKLFIDGKEYNVLNCRYAFNQDMDLNGKPLAIIRGGLVDVTLESSGDFTFPDWAFNPSGTRDGMIIFYKRDAIAPLSKIEFKEGYCTNFKEVFNPKEGAMKFTIEICAKDLTINGVSAENTLRGHFVADYYYPFGQQGKKQTLESLGISTAGSVQSIAEQLLQKMPIGDYMDGSEFNFFNKWSSMGMTKVTRVSKTQLKVTPTMMGRVYGIGKNATITMTKMKTISGKFEGPTQKIENFSATGLGVQYFDITILEIDNRTVTNFVIDRNKGYFYKSKGIINAFDLP